MRGVSNLVVKDKNSCFWVSGNSVKRKSENQRQERQNLENVPAQNERGHQKWRFRLRGPWVTLGMPRKAAEFAIVGVWWQMEISGSGCRGFMSIEDVT
jgi:hypothetical protein